MIGGTFRKIVKVKISPFKVSAPWQVWFIIIIGIISYYYYTYVFRKGNFQFIIALQILTRGQLKKMSNDNLIASFLALQGNITLQ